METQKRKKAKVEEEVEDEETNEADGEEAASKIEGEELTTRKITIKRK